MPGKEYNTSYIFTSSLIINVDLRITLLSLNLTNQIYNFDNSAISALPTARVWCLRQIPL